MGGPLKDAIFYKGSQDYAPDRIMYAHKYACLPTIGSQFVEAFLVYALMYTIVERVKSENVLYLIENKYFFYEGKVFEYFSKLLKSLGQKTLFLSCPELSVPI